LGWGGSKKMGSVIKEVFTTLARQRRGLASKIVKLEISQQGSVSGFDVPSASVRDR